MEPKHSIYISSNYLVNLIRRIKKEIFVKRKYLNTKQIFLVDNIEARSIWMFYA